MHMIDGGIRSRRCRRKSARLNNRCTAFTNSRNKDILVPCCIINHIFDRLAINACKAIVGIHRRAVIAPNNQFLDIGNGFVGLTGQL